VDEIKVLGLPWPPGYMHRKTRPSSSAWARPEGVSSPPHLRMSRREASRGVSETSEDEI